MTEHQPGLPDAQPDSPDAQKLERKACKPERAAPWAESPHNQSCRTNDGDAEPESSAALRSNAPRPSPTRGCSANASLL